VKAANVLLGLGLGGIILYNLARARFIGDLQVRAIGAKIKSLYNIQLTLQFTNPSNVTATINTVTGILIFQGNAIADFAKNEKFTIPPGISTTQLDARIDLVGLIKLGFGSISGIKTPLVAKIQGFAISGAIRIPLNQTINIFS
jgi:hypothetical protein